MKAAYRRAVEREDGAPLVFSTEFESYPLELKRSYPRKSGVFQYLNSGMWAGPVRDAKALLRVMSGVDVGGEAHHNRLMRHYVNWGQLNTEREKIPPAYLENDQVKYAELYLARLGRLRGGADRHRLSSRIGLDRHLDLFENMFHAGAHSADGGQLVNSASRRRPVVVHFNGPAKVVFEREWRVPWDATAGRTPVAWLTDTVRSTFGAAAREAAARAFESNVTFLDPLFRRVTDVGPLHFSCETERGPFQLAKTS